VYSLRFVDINYWGIYLTVLVLLLTILRLSDFARYYSLLLFWVRANNALEFNKPFVLNRAFSVMGFLFRALVFGGAVNVLYTGSLTPYSFGVEIGFWSLGFIGFWCVKTGLEVMLTSLIGQSKNLMKIFFIRTINKEKLAFLYSLLIVIFAFIPLPKLILFLLFGLYFLGLMTIHISTLKFYFKAHRVKKMLIILYICASEIAPLWMVLQILKH